MLSPALATSANDGVVIFGSTEKYIASPIFFVLFRLNFTLVCCRIPLTVYIKSDIFGSGRRYTV